MGKRKIDKREKASIRKRERRKERQRVARYLDEARLFSYEISLMSFVEKFPRIVRFIDRKWKKNRSALIYIATDTNENGTRFAMWEWYRKDDWKSLDDAAFHASTNQNIEGVPILRITEDMMTEQFVRTAKTCIGL